MAIKIVIRRWCSIFVVFIHFLLSVMPTTVASFLLRTTRGASLLRRLEDDAAARAAIEPVIFMPTPSLSSASLLAASSSSLSSLFCQDELEPQPAAEVVELNDEAAAKEELSPYYRRDNREPASVLSLLSDPAGLASLLEQRHHARQNGDYRRVSAVDRQLQRDHGVRAYDQPPVWTRLTALPPPAAFRRRQARKRTRQMQRAFGPTGHPYRYRLRGEATMEGQLPNTQEDQDYDNGNHNHHYRRSAFCDLTVSEIHALLRRLTQCRWPSTTNHNQSEEADAIRLELAIRGVRVCDETWQWWTATTTDDDDSLEFDDVPVAAFASSASSSINNNTAVGATNSSSSRSSAATSFSSFTPPPPPPPPLPTMSYTQDPLSKPLRGSAGRRRDDKDKDSITRVRQRVEQLLRGRAEARARGELQTTKVAGEHHHQQQQQDEYGDDHWARELYCTYNVRINDRTRKWSVGGRILTAEDGEGEGEGVGAEEWKPQAPQPRIKNDGEREDEHIGIVRFPSTRRLLFGDRDERDFDSETRYRCSSRSLPRTTMSKLSWHRVQALIQDRIHKREEGRFLEADAIRRELWYTYNVGVNDRLQQYSVGGSYDDHRQGQ